MREHSTVRRHADRQREDTRAAQNAEVDPHDDDLFVDGDQRRRERLMAVGALKPERFDADLPRFVKGAQPPALPKPARKPPNRSEAAEDTARRPTRPWVFALLGFICGIGFWHAIGFWGFITQIVQAPPPRPVPVASSADAPAQAQPGGQPNYQPARPTRTKP